MRKLFIYFFSLFLIFLILGFFYFLRVISYTNVMIGKNIDGIAILTGGKGIIGIINSPRNGNIASSLVVSEIDEIILSTDKGSIMRCAVKEIRVAGRNTQGVRIKKLSGNEKVVSVIKIEDNIQ